MSLEISKAKQRELEKPFWTRFWGQRCLSRPAFCPTILGDGYQLIALTPLATRPNYYLIRVHSSWSLDSGDENCLAEHLDDVYDALEEYFGPVEYEGDHGETCEADWPAFDFGCGQCWSSAMDLLGLAPKPWDPVGWWGIKPLTMGNYDVR